MYLMILEIIAYQVAIAYSLVNDLSDYYLDPQEN